MKKERRGLGKTLRHILYLMLLTGLLVGGCGGDDESGDNMQTPTGQTPTGQTSVAGTKGHCAVCLHDSECADNLKCYAYADNLGIDFRCSTRPEEPACRFLSP